MAANEATQATVSASPRQLTTTAHTPSAMSPPPARPGRVFAVVVNHNGGPGLLDCLAALAAGRVKPDVVVVDNASTDGSPEAARARFPDIALLRNSRNRLFAPAANQGIAHALARSAAFVLVANADVVVSPECLGQLVRCLEADQGIGACQPLLTFPGRPGIIQSAGCLIGATGRAVDALAGRPVAAAGQEPRAVPGVTGACLLLSGRAIRRAGPFCDAFGMYFEDVEFSLRLRSLGYGVLCLPMARASHVGGASARAYGVWKKTCLCERNALLTAVRCFPASRAAAALVLGPASAAAAALAHLCAGRISQAAALLAGSLAGVLAAPAQLAHRRAMAARGARPGLAWSQVAAATVFPQPAPRR